LPKIINYICKNLFLPAAINMFTEILGKKPAYKLKVILVSNKTFQQSIVEISEK